LLETPDDNLLYQEFASAILTSLPGPDVLRAIDTLTARGETVNKASLANELEIMGYETPTATTKHLILLQWLRKARVLPPRGYSVDKQVLASLLNSEPTVLSDVDELSQAELYFLRSLARIETDADSLVKVSEVMGYAEKLYQAHFPEDTWQAALLKPLEKKGWIELVRGSSGRGSRSGLVKGTGQFESEYVRRLLEEDAADIPSDLRKRLQTPLPTILLDLESDDTHVKGMALELLALRLATFLDLKFRKWRLRHSEKTGGAEVDLIVEGSRLIFTRWQIQCKNTQAVALDDLAKEVGLALLLKSQVVMLVTTGRFASSVSTHARRVNESTALQVVLIDGVVLKTMVSGARAAPGALVDVLNKQARETLRQKSSQIEDT